MIGLKLVVLPLLNLTKTIRDQLNGIRNMQSFALIQAVSFFFIFQIDVQTKYNNQEDKTVRTIGKRSK